MWLSVGRRYERLPGKLISYLGVLGRVFRAKLQVAYGGFSMCTFNENKPIEIHASSQTLKIIKIMPQWAWFCHRWRALLELLNSGNFG